jgi:hypothetical protein
LHIRTAHPSLPSSPVLTHLWNNINSILNFIDTLNLPDTIRMIPIIPHVSICKQLTCPHKISQLRHRLLWIIPFGSIEVTPEYTPTLKELSLASGGRGEALVRTDIQRGGAISWHTREA